MEQKTQRMVKIRLGLLVAGIFLSGLVQADTLFVFSQPPYSYDIDPDTNEPNNCREASKACETIAHAMGQAHSGDVIDLASQIYDVINVTITKDVTFEGNGINNTIIRSPINVTARHFTVDIDDDTMSATDYNAVVTFKDLTLRGGNAQDENGGSVRVVDGGLVVRNAKFKNNRAANGGAINCVFEGVDLCRSIDVKNSTFMGNTADGNPDLGDGRGGAMYIKTYKRAAVSPLATSTFIDNAANFAGGAIYYYDQVNNIDKSSFTGNTAGNLNIENSAGFGGAIYFDYSVTHIKKSLFEHNYATTGGGALYVGGDLGGQFIGATNSTFSENSTNGFGGAMYLNIASSDRSYFSNLTFYGNSTALNSLGATLYADVNFNMSKSIISDSRGAEACEGGANVIGFSNLIDDASCGNFSVAATQFSTLLADNGGLTKTHSIGGGSNARDDFGVCLGDAGNTLTHDQRGEPRDSNCDIGAYEVPVGVPFMQPVEVQLQIPISP